MDKLTLLSPAKINLTLRVSGARPDGFHDLDSIVIPLGLVDEILLEKSGERRAESGEGCEGDAQETADDADGGRLGGVLPHAGCAIDQSANQLISQSASLEVISETVDLTSMPEEQEKNLAMRALRLLEKEVGRALPTRIVIKKNIPLGGGLGGGSSNAATVLRGVNELWELGVSQERLCELGAQLGSDVALFIMDGLVRMQGRGEQVERLESADMKPMWVVLANCGEHCSTPAVYRAFDALKRAESGERRAESGECCAEDDAVAKTRPRKTEQDYSASVVWRQLHGMNASEEDVYFVHEDVSGNVQASKLPNYQTSNLTDGDEICDNLCFFLRAREIEAVSLIVVNDLEEPCFKLFPRVAETARALEAAGCTGVRLCGSGATVFGLVQSREEGENALAHPALAGCWRACVQTLPDGVMAAHGPLTPIVMVRIHVGQP